MSCTIEYRKLAAAEDHAILLESSNLTLDLIGFVSFRNPVEWLETRDLSELPMFFQRLRRPAPKDCGVRATSAMNAAITGSRGQPSTLSPARKTCRLPHSASIWLPPSSPPIRVPPGWRTA